MKCCKILLSTLILAVFFNGISAKHVYSHEAVLIGGGLKICSSYSQKNCRQPMHFASNAFTQKLYQINASLVEKIKEDKYQLFVDRKALESVVSMLKQILDEEENQALLIKDKKDLTRLLKSKALMIEEKFGLNPIRDLTDLQWHYLLQMLEAPRVDQKGSPLIEYVSWRHSDKHAQDIIHTLVERTRKISHKKKPLILIATSSSEDVFDAVSFYLQLFEQAGVDTAWLPIEASLNELTQYKHSTQCKNLENYRATHYAVFNRSDVYPMLSEWQQKFCRNPHLFKLLVERADGIFFNGGDQWLTRRSLLLSDTPEAVSDSLYQQIKSQVQSGNLLIAGTSAGTAVQSGGHGLWGNHETRNNDSRAGYKTPMVISGESIKGFINGIIWRKRPWSLACQMPVNANDRGCDAKRNEAYVALSDSGGFDWLSIGFIDTHFSQRDRQLRMYRVLNNSMVITGWGVDENTALVLSKQHGRKRFDVVGEGSVWLMQRKQQTRKSNERVMSDVKLQALREGDYCTQRSDRLICTYSANHSLTTNRWLARFEEGVSKGVASGEITTEDESGIVWQLTKNKADSYLNFLLFIRKEGAK